MGDAGGAKGALKQPGREKIGRGSQELVGCLPNGEIKKRDPMINGWLDIPAPAAG